MGSQGSKGRGERTRGGSKTLLGARSAWCHESQADHPLGRANQPLSTTRHPTTSQGGGPITTQRWDYDDAGRVERQTDALDHDTEFSYDRAGRKLTETRPLDFQRIWTWHAFDQLASYTDADGHRTQYRYDTRQRLIEEENDLAEVTVHGYDAVGNRTSTRKPGEVVGVEWEFTYDAADRLSTVISPEGSDTRYGYDLDGNRSLIDDANRHRTQFRYDAEHRLRQVEFADLTQVDYTHDGNRNRVRSDQAGRRIESSYDLLNRETQRSYSSGPSDATDPAQPQQLTWRYDGLGRGPRIGSNGRPAGIHAPEILKRTSWFDRRRALIMYLPFVGNSVSDALEYAEERIGTEDSEAVGGALSRAASLLAKGSSAQSDDVVVFEDEDGDGVKAK